MNCWFTVPEEEYDNDENSDVNYDIFEDENVIKVKSEQYAELVKEMERYNKMQENVKK